ncbi:hypothetical protein [Polymorphospora lycopeni]|uniref:Uncharacterized protein n=1 Tax=Polymorphospora lycopeni TaxID=3140240 RepID=A0ABV5CNL2_9ACTN
MATYQVVGECAYVTVAGATGAMRTLVMKGAIVPESAPELRHLLASGLVARADGETGGVNADGVPAALVDDGKKPGKATAEQSKQSQSGAAKAEEQAKADAEQAERRKAAQEKLADLGGKAPDGRASHDVLVEYLVSQGGSYDDLVKSDKAALVELVKSRQS